MVVATHVDSGTRTERVTDASGRFLLASLRGGAYSLTVEIAGFKRVISRCDGRCSTC
jgi:hypothetical protein